MNGTDWVQKTKGTFMIDSKFEFIYAVPFAIVPILIVKHVATGWSCDISFSHGLGVEMSLFVKHLFKLQPEAKKLALYVCIWCKNYEIKIKNFFLVVLVIFYMQTKGLLPSVKRVQDRCSLRQIGGEFNQSNVINFFNVLFCRLYCWL